jgi:hypothetical protein
MRLCVSVAASQDAGNMWSTKLVGAAVTRLLSSRQFEILAEGEYIFLTAQHPQNCQ